ncbi:MAG: hypothetical protein WD101_04115 [Gemmatimonadota bacterium]
MPSYPIEVPRKGYGGTDSRLRREAEEFNRDAAILERHINETFVASGQHRKQFLYGYIAIDTGIPQDRVRDILFTVDCGHNGFSVWKQKDGETGS